MAEFQRITYDFNSRFTLNDNTSDTDKWALLDVTTLLDTLAINTEEVRPEQPGIVDFGTKLGKGEWEVPVTLYASSVAQMAQLIENLKQAFNPDLLEADATYGEATQYNGYHPMDWTETVGVTSRDFRMYIKSLEVPKISGDSFAGLIRSTRIKLKMEDPRKFLQAQTTLADGGTATNAGTYPTPVIITITATGASSTSLTINNDTTGEKVYVTTALADGEALVIDTRLHSAKLDGVEQRDMIGSSTKWWSLDPGANTLSISNGTNVTVSTAWRSAWPI